MKLLAVTALVASASAADCTFWNMPDKVYSDAKCTTEKTDMKDADKTAALKKLNDAMNTKCLGAAGTFMQTKCEGKTITAGLYSDDKCTKKKDPPKTEEKKEETKTEEKKEEKKDAGPPCMPFGGAFAKMTGANMLAASVAAGAAIMASLY